VWILSGPGYNGSNFDVFSATVLARPDGKWSWVLASWILKPGSILNQNMESYHYTTQQGSQDSGNPDDIRSGYFANEIV